MDNCLTRELINNMAGRKCEKKNRKTSERVVREAHFTQLPKGSETLVFCALNIMDKWLTRGMNNMATNAVSSGCTKEEENIKRASERVVREAHFTQLPKGSETLVFCALNIMDKWLTRGMNNMATNAVSSGCTKEEENIKRASERVVREAHFTQLPKGSETLVFCALNIMYNWL
eukprot:TRINITY_DN5273_c0_g1_i1.p1 TRINITY_DN5273_c0_g1~~TRINITY_DN5273_c0_g1_i1.p1  ORF type:complete len:174 (-),score=12.63 TRINITY_DN5273_c0_g1_i1:126-647(-)